MIGIFLKFVMKNSKVHRTYEPQYAHQPTSANSSILPFLFHVFFPLLPTPLLLMLLSLFKRKREGKGKRKGKEEERTGGEGRGGKKRKEGKEKPCW